MEPTQATGLQTFLTPAGRKTKQASFSFSRARVTPLKYSYHTLSGAGHNTKCITVNTCPILNRVVFSFYSDTQYPHGWEKTSETKTVRCIRYDHEIHVPQLHKKNNPQDTHYHAQVSLDDNPDSFIQSALTELGFDAMCVKDLYASAQYLNNHPTEPGLAFESGNYSENGVAVSLDENSCKADYYEGPYWLFGSPKLSSLRDPDRPETRANTSTAPNLAQRLYRSALRSILPTGVIGSSSQNSISLGTL